MLKQVRMMTCAIILLAGCVGNDQDDDSSFATATPASSPSVTATPEESTPPNAVTESPEATPTLEEQTAATSPEDGPTATATPGVPTSVPTALPGEPTPQPTESPDPLADQWDWACGSFLEQSADFLIQMLDPVTGLPYDQLPCNSSHQSQEGFPLSFGVFPQASEGDIGIFVAGDDPARVPWHFVDGLESGEQPTLFTALALPLLLPEATESTPDPFGGLTWRVDADIRRYDRIAIRYRTSSPDATFELKLASHSSQGAFSEPAVALEGTTSSGAWRTEILNIEENFAGVFRENLTYVTLASSASLLQAQEGTLWVDHLAFLADQELVGSCEVTTCDGMGDGEACIPDLAVFELLTGAVNIANALTSLSLLPEVSALSLEEAFERVALILDTLEGMPGAAANPSADGSAWAGGGWVQDWHGASSGMPDPRNRHASITDEPQLFAALMVVEQTWPELAAQAAALREKMDFAVLYAAQEGGGSCPGTLYGAVDACTGVVEGWQSAYYGTDALLGHWLAVATEGIPADWWTDCLAPTGCQLSGTEALPYYYPGAEEANSIPATDNGGPFLQLAGLLYLDSARVPVGSSLSLGASAGNMISSQAEYARELELRLWGWANASDPSQCDYMTVEEFANEKVSPYVSAMGLELLPEALENLYGFQEDGAGDPATILTRSVALGLRDGWDQSTQSARPAYLYLDTGWGVLGALNACYDGLVRARFGEHPLAQAGYERFGALEAPCP